MLILTAALALVFVASAPAMTRAQQRADGVRGIPGLPSGMPAAAAQDEPSLPKQG